MVTSSEARASPSIGDLPMTAPYGMTLTDYLKACEAQGLGLVSNTLSDVMADTVVALNELAAVVLVSGALGHGRRSLTRIVDDAKLACGDIGKSDAWLYVLDIKASSAVSFAGRLELAGMKVSLMREAL